MAQYHFQVCLTSSKNDRYYGDVEVRPFRIRGRHWQTVKIHTPDPLEGQSVEDGATGLLTGEVQCYSPGFKHQHRICVSARDL